MLLKEVDVVERWLSHSVYITNTQWQLKQRRLIILC